MVNFSIDRDIKYPSTGICDFREEKCSVLNTFNSQLWVITALYELIL